MNGLNEIHASNVKEVLAAYAKAIHAGDKALVKNLRTAHPDLSTRFDLVNAEQQTA
jgi:hypothetical protein